MRDLNSKIVNIDCVEVNKISPYIDGNLSFDQKKKFEQHLQNCNVCYENMNTKTKYLQTIEELIPVKHLAINEQKDLEIEIEELFHSFKKKSNLQTAAKKIISKVVDLF